MCGRGACTLSVERCRRVAAADGRARATAAVNRLRCRYNLGPQSFVPIVRELPGDHSADSENREVSAMRWGLVPAFAKSEQDYDVFKGGASTFNARIEGLESSGMWRRLLDGHRCVVLFDGFYEWKAVGKTKKPMFIRHLDGYSGNSISPAEAESRQEPRQETAWPEGSEAGPSYPPLLLAGLYDVWQKTDSADKGEQLETVAIVTMESEGTPLAQVHDRMPVFLTPETAATWIDPAKRYADICEKVKAESKAHSEKWLLVHEVSALVSNVRNDSADCVLPKTEYDAKHFAKGLGRFFQKKAVPSTGKRMAAHEPLPKESAGKAMRFE